MTYTRYVVLAALIWLWLAPLAARADDTTTPVVVPTEPVQVEPTVAPPPPVIEPTAPPPPIEQPTEPVQDTNPVTVSGEQSTPVARVDTGNPSSDILPSPQATEAPLPVARPTAPVSSVSPPETQSETGQSTTPAVTTSQAAPPPDTTLPPVDSTTNPDAGVTSTIVQPTSAQAPAQLTCSGKRHPNSGPFLVSPYRGWTEIVSFVDHDLPDYTVDGTIVIANGLTARASDGQASDLFPAYWSPALRQYINYDGHNGYDFDISYQPVLAAASGKILYAGWNADNEYVGYGQMILIQHRDGYVTLYGHLSKLEVKTGDTVTAGQEIGISGTTGHSSGPHLHFSVFHDCQVTDPYGWTGHGRDPLTDFDGEHATYLWLPGHDPLVLNPPPNWPTYPLGLHIALPPDEGGTPNGNSPAVDRLLLLALPSPHSDGSVSAAVALARTEASVTQEAEAVAPQLDDLKAQGLIQNYQVIPAAGAIWVHGTASSRQLEALDGVASLSGVEPHDLLAAQAGLAHSVLIQIGKQQAPSLWPVGYRSALHPWRPVLTVLTGHALIAGFTLPGQQVVVSLERGNDIPGAAEAQGDPQTGGFVAMIHDPFGSPLSVKAGDTVIVQSGGRQSVVTVPHLSLRAHVHTIRAVARSGASVSVTMLPPLAESPLKSLLTGGKDGAVSSNINAALPAGTLAVASVVDRAGNTAAATTYVPGLLATVGDGIVSGWTVGRDPILTITRRRAVLDKEHLNVAPDGSFEVNLQHHGRPLVLQSGDALQIGSPRHHHTVVIPALHANLMAGAHSLSISGPKSTLLHVTINRADGSQRVNTLRLQDSSSMSVPLKSAVELGDSASVEYVLPGGSRAQGVGLAQGLLIHEGASRVSGQVRRNVPVSVRLLDRSGASLGSGFTTSDPSTGAFSVIVKNPKATKVQLSAGDTILIRDGQDSTSLRIPPLGVRLDRSSGRITGTLQGARSGVLQLRFTAGDVHTQRLTGSSPFAIQLHGSQTTALSHVRLTEDLPGGIAVERQQVILAINSGAVECAAKHRKTTGSTSAGCAPRKAGKP